MLYLLHRVLILLRAPTPTKSDQAYHHTCEADHEPERIPEGTQQGDGHVWPQEHRQTQELQPSGLYCLAESRDARHYKDIIDVFGLPKTPGERL